MAADDSEHARVEMDEADLARLIRLMAWNTFWTGAGSVAGWIALAIVVVAIILK